MGLMRLNMTKMTLTLLCFLTAAALTGCSRGPEPDMVLFNGKIVTVDAQDRIVDAIGIKGDRLVSAGVAADVLRSAGRNTTRIDLRGKTVLPGLIDSHSHAAAASLYEFDHPVPDMETIRDRVGMVEHGWFLGWVG